MTNHINDGGPAFATTSTATSIARREDGSSMLTNYGSSAGMSLRDYFAAAALQGLMAQVKPEDHWAEYRAKWSYEVADAMLERRKR